MNKIYKNKKWLTDKYIDEKLSTRKIGILCQVTHKTILDTMKKYNIPTRAEGESKHLAKANHCKLSQNALEWIDGEMLGDGCLSSRNPYSAYFRYSSKHKEYIEYVRDTLESFGIRYLGKLYKVHHKKGDYYSYQYNSKCYSELKPIQLDWYPEGKKIVPKNITLNPLTVRQWYIGDGSLIHHKKCRPYIKLCTNGFTIRDVEWLTDQLNNLEFEARRQPSDNIILILVNSTKDFLKYIGEYPVECYKYKWNY